MAPDTLLIVDEVVMLEFGIIVDPEELFTIIVPLPIFIIIILFFLPDIADIVGKVYVAVVPLNI